MTQRGRTEHMITVICASIAMTSDVFSNGTDKIILPAEIYNIPSKVLDITDELRNHKCISTVLNFKESDVKRHVW